MEPLVEIGSWESHPVAATRVESVDEEGPVSFCGCMCHYRTVRSNSVHAYARPPLTFVDAPLVPPPPLMTSRNTVPGFRPLWATTAPRPAGRHRERLSDGYRWWECNGGSCRHVTDGDDDAVVGGDIETLTRARPGVV